MRKVMFFLFENITICKNNNWPKIYNFAKIDNFAIYKFNFEIDMLIWSVADGVVPPGVIQVIHRAVPMDIINMHRTI